MKFPKNALGGFRGETCSRTDGHTDRCYFSYMISMNPLTARNT